MQLIYTNLSTDVGNLLPDLENILKSLETFKTLQIQICFDLDDDYRIFRSTINYYPYETLIPIFLHQLYFFCKCFDLHTEDVFSYEIKIYLDK